MYLPDHFREVDPAEIGEIVATHPLACVVAQTDAGLTSPPASGCSCAR